MSTYVRFESRRPRINVRGEQKPGSFCLAAPRGDKDGLLSKQAAVTQSVRLHTHRQNIPWMHWILEHIHACLCLCDSVFAYQRWRTLTLMRADSCCFYRDSLFTVCSKWGKLTLNFSYVTKQCWTLLRTRVPISYHIIMTNEGVWAHTHILWSWAISTARAVIGWRRGVRIPILRCPCPRCTAGCSHTGTATWYFRLHATTVLPLPTHSDSLDIAWNDKKKNKQTRATGPVIAFSSLYQRQSEITFRQRAGTQHKLDTSFVTRWKKTTTVSLQAELCQLKHFASYTLGVVRFRGTKLGAGQRNTLPNDVATSIDLCKVFPNSWIGTLKKFEPLFRSPHVPGSGLWDRTQTAWLLPLSSGDKSRVMWHQLETAIFIVQISQPSHSAVVGQEIQRRASTARRKSAFIPHSFNPPHPSPTRHISTKCPLNDLLNS